MLSFVVPVFNEEESLEAFFDRVSKIAPKLAKSYEFVFVDDGSTDSSLKILQKLAEKSPLVRIYSFRRNQGKAEALTYGFQKAQGDLIVTLDADLQDRPEEIEKLLEKNKEGFDVVSGWRKERKDATKMKLISKLFNWIMGIIWGVRLHDYNCGLKLYTSDAAKSLRLYGGMHRFIPLLVSEQGFLVTEVPVVHDKRKFGKSKYGFSKIFKDLPDMLTMLFLTRYGKRPLHFFGVVGMAFSLIGFLILFYLWILQLQGHSIGRRPLLFVGFFAIIAGLQILFSGFLADLIINIAHNNRAVDMSPFKIKYTTDKK